MVQNSAVPSFGDYINSGAFSTEGHNGLSRFFQKYLLQKAMSVFKWDMPAVWSKNYFLYTLYCCGWISVINTRPFGVIPQGCSLTGYNVFYNPTNAVICNPLLRGITNPRIDVDCTVIKLQPDYGSIMDLVTYYGDMMATAATTCGINLHNSKLSYIFTAKNKSTAATFKELYKRLSNGEPMAVVDKDLFTTDGSPAWQAFEQNVGQNYIVDKLLADLRKLENMFDTAIGIPNANIEKRERMIVDEVNANNAETATLCEMWLDELRDGLNKTNRMFGLNLSVDWRHNPVKQGGVKNDVV